MFKQLKSFLTLIKKEEKHDLGQAFVRPVLKDIQKDIEIMNTSFQKLQHLVDLGFKIGFDKVPAEQLTDLLEKSTELAALIESSNMKNKVKLTELIAQMHDNASDCSGMMPFLVNSSDPDLNIKKIMSFFENIQNEFKEVSKLL